MWLETEVGPKTNSEMWEAGVKTKWEVGFVGTGLSQLMGCYPLPQKKIVGIRLRHLPHTPFKYLLDFPIACISDFPLAWVSTRS